MAKKQQAKAKLDNLQFTVKEELSNRWLLTVDYTAQIPKTSNTHTKRISGRIVRAKDGSLKFSIRVPGLRHSKQFTTKQYDSAEVQAFSILRRYAKAAAHAAIDVTQKQFESLRKQWKDTAKETAKRPPGKGAELVAVGRGHDLTLTRRRAERRSNSDKLFKQSL